jgi:predicted HicB family RNase H-like nuclease
MAEPRLKRLNIIIEEDLHNAFKAAAAADGKNMTDLVIKFIENYVEKNMPSGLKKRRK